jgi:hypothetical protein
LEALRALEVKAGTFFLLSAICYLLTGLGPLGIGGCWQCWVKVLSEQEHEEDFLPLFFARSLSLSLSLSLFHSQSWYFFLSFFYHNWLSRLPKKLINRTHEGKLKQE